MDEKFIKAFDTYKLDVFRLSFSYLHSTYDAEDILENTFLKLYKHKDVLKRTDLEIKKWLIKVAINESKKYSLTPWKKKVTKISEDNLYKYDIKEDNTLEELFKLERKYSLILYLYYYENYKLKEIASILNISETNAQTRLARARLKLKELLERK